jgi:hypothetical protein
VVPSIATKRRKRKPQPRCKVSRRRKPRAKRTSAAEHVFDPQAEAGARRRKRTKRPDPCRRRKRRRPRRPVATSDFRGVSCSLLEDSLNVDAGPIIPGADSLPRHALVRP